jgi:hypothetical protein
MSLLRPPGKADVPRFRRVNKKRRVLAVGITVVVLAAVGAGGVLLVKAGSRHAACQQAAYVPPPPQHAPVNVYNSTTKGGFAEQVRGELQQHGFPPGEIGNDPERRKIRGTGELRYGPEGQAQVNALLPYNDGMRPLLDKHWAKGATVDFVIGDSFTELSATPAPPLGAKQPCVPVAPAH